MERNAIIPVIKRSTIDTSTTVRLNCLALRLFLRPLLVLLFIYSPILTGVVSACAYEILKLFRKLIRHSGKMIAVEDIFYWIGISIYGFYQLYFTTYGVVRWYFILGVVCGWISEKMVAKKLENHRKTK